MREVLEPLEPARSVVFMAVWGEELGMVGADQYTVRQSIARPLNASLMIAFVLSLFWHSQLGLQVVIEDYVHAPLWAGVAHLANIFVCALAAIAGVLAIVRIALGS